MVTEPSWLRAWADASAVLLLLEACVVLVIMVALVFLLAFGARWLRMHVTPVLNEATPRARQALRMADAGTERVARGVAEVYGIRQAVEAGLRALVRGTVVDVLAGAAPATPAPGAAATATSAAPAARATTERQPAPERQRPATPSSAPRQPAGGRDTGGMGAHAG
jgi:hypothetical protein